MPHFDRSASTPRTRATEVTRDDVLAVLEDLHGSRRENTVVALRSLFAFCKRSGVIFCNPASRIKVGQRAYGLIQPLTPGDVDQAVTAATTPAARLLLALAAVARRPNRGHP